VQQGQPHLSAKVNDRQNSVMLKRYVDGTPQTKRRPLTFDANGALCKKSTTTLVCFFFRDLLFRCGRPMRARVYVRV
jgi:hypothetical protein